MATATKAPDAEDAQNTPTEGEDESGDKSDRAALEALAPGTRVSVMITMPKELKLLLLEKAEEKGFTLARYLREWIAGQLDFTLPETTRTRAPKYATPEEREAAQKAQAKQRNALIKTLLEAYRKGEIDLNALQSDDDEDDDDE